MHSNNLFKVGVNLFDLSRSQKNILLFALTDKDDIKLKKLAELKDSDGFISDEDIKRVVKNNIDEVLRFITFLLIIDACYLIS